MKVIIEAVTGYLPSKYDRREVTLDPDAGVNGERLVVITSAGARYTITENSDGNLELMEHGACALFTHNTSSNVLEVMAVPLFVSHRVVSHRAPVKEKQ